MMKEGWRDGFKEEWWEEGGSNGRMKEGRKKVGGEK